MRPSTGGARILVVALAVASLGACTGGGERATPTTTTPPPVTASPTSFSIVTVPGNPRTSTTAPSDISPGEATLVGTVTGPEGPVSDAIVRLERLVGDEGPSVDVRVVDGQWQLPQVRGGRYRARAWRAPDLAQLEPQVFFVGATETKQITLTVMRFGDVSVTAATDPAPLPVGQPASLVTQVLSGGVDAEGVVRASPRPGLAVQLVLGGGIALESPDRQVTDAEGRNLWRVRCLQAAPPLMAMIVGPTRYPVSVPACVAG